MLAQQLIDSLGVLTSHQTKVHLGFGIAGQDCLAALSDIAGVEAADVSGRPIVVAFQKLFTGHIVQEVVDA